MPVPPTSPPAGICAVCAASLPDGAIYCPRCGSATPVEFTREGEAVGPGAAPPSAAEDAAHRRRLQAALGPTVELRELLGRGGFAEVYVAYDKRLKRELAVKTLRPDLLVSDTLLERFQREAEAVAKLRHPNVIPIYTVGEGEGIAYFLMPRIEGESLAAAVEREGRLPVDEAARILREAAAALGAAHRQGIVHRDIKPENIMLEGPDRRTLVMDFGIAKSAEPNAGQRGLTGTGTLVGTPHYMSPEQATGERDVDHRTDQYSLAMVGFRMLTGRLAFDADTIQTLIFKQVTQPAARASDVDPNVPEALSDVLARALAKRPDDRFPSMEAFAAAVAASVAPAPTAAAVAALQPRREEPIAARVAQMRRDVAPWRSPVLLIAALLALAGALWVDRETTAAPALDLAGGRSEALFAARSFLAGRGVADARKVDQHFETQGATYSFLQRALGPDAGRRRAATDFVPWSWHITLRDPARGERWLVHVGPANRILAFTAPPADTARADSLAADSARALAARELAALGWSPESLTFASDSVVRHGARVDHILRWRRRGVAWRGGDSAVATVAMTVAGVRVAEYDARRLTLPASYLREHPTDRSNPGGAYLGLVLLGFALYACYLAISRQRTDVLQWQMASRAAMALAAVLAIPLLVGLVNDVTKASSETTALRGGNAGGEVLGNLVAALLFAAWAIITVVAGESLTFAQRPAVYAGVRELSRGRVYIPEVVTAAAVGLPVGFLVALLYGLGAVAQVALGWGVSGVEVSSAFDFTFPSVLLLLLVGLCGVFALMLPFYVAVPRQMRLPLAAAALFPGAVLALGIADGLSAAGTSAALALAIAALGLTAWRYGALAATVATSTALLLPVAAQLLRSGGGEFVSSGVIALALLAAPAVLAVVAYRRLGKAGS